jgi:NADH-quinone oxidoreductase subunit J
MASLPMAHVIFLILAVACVGGVLAMLFSARPSHGALFLVLSFAALGGIFGLLGAPFLAAVQVLVYAGAIMVLFIFVVMMIDPRADSGPAARPWFLPTALLLSAFLLAGLLWAARRPLAVRAGARAVAAPAELGRLLFTKYLYPFEAASLLILAALVGAVILSRRKDAP